jgi:putative heme iron utilization protein
MRQCQERQRDIFHLRIEQLVEFIRVLSLVQQLPEKAVVPICGKHTMAVLDSYIDWSLACPG